VSSQSYWLQRFAEVRSPRSIQGFATLSIQQILSDIVRQAKYTLIDTKRKESEPTYTNSGALVFDAVAIN
jgi:hypothetical protein